MNFPFRFYRWAHKLRKVARLECDYTQVNDKDYIAYLCTSVLRVNLCRSLMREIADGLDSQSANMNDEFSALC